jgi:DHA3 family tetracycline resistance protein-like MFS transporter
VSERFANIKKLDARRVFYLLSAGNALFFSLAFTVNMIYQVDTIGLTPLQLVLVGTALEVSVFVFEVPTGIVADVYSRRLSIIIGVFLIGVGISLEGAIPAFWAVLLGQATWGLGYTFTSGATQAWLVDEVGKENVGDIFVRASQIGRVTGLVGMIAATLLGALQINLPILLGGMSFWLMGTFLVLFMPENGFKPAPNEDRNSWQSMARTFREGLRMIRGKTILITLVGIGLFFGLFSEGYDRLDTAHLLTNFQFPTMGGLTLQPVLWFGIFGLIGTPVGLIAAEILRRKVDSTQSREAIRALFVISSGMVVSLAVFALAGNLLVAVLANMAFGTFRGIVWPVFHTWSNQHIDSSVRATVLSMFGQVDAIGQIVGGPPVGFVGERLGIRAALLTSSLILSPVLLLIVRARRLGGGGTAPVTGEVAVQEV